MKIVEDDYTVHRRLLFVDDPKGRKVSRLLSAETEMKRTAFFNGDPHYPQVSLDKVDLVEEALKKILPSEDERTEIKAKVVSFTVDGEPAEALAGRLLKAGLPPKPNTLNPKP